MCILFFSIILQATELQDLSSQLSKTPVKCGPCESTVEPVLQSNNIQRQKYFGGAFIGNHVHHALQRSVTHQLAYAHVPTISSRCPGLLPEALVVAERYDKLMTFYADCHQIFSSSGAVNAETLFELEAKIKFFMSTARSEIVQRSRGHITPKLHLLECHVVPSMRRFGVGLGLLGEQGGESIHAEFNLLQTTFRSVVRELDRLKMVVQQHCLTTLPQELAKVPSSRRK